MTDTNLREPDPISWEEREEGGGKFKDLPAKGQYLFAVTEVAVGATSDGYKDYTLTVKLIDEAIDADPIKFVHITTKVFPWRKSTSVMDFIAACGVKLSGSPTNADYDNVVNSLVNKPFMAGLDWSGKCKVCGTYQNGQDVFPVVDGKRQSWMDCPNGCVDADDNTRKSRVFANAKIKYYIVAK